MNGTHLPGARASASRRVIVIGAGPGGLASALLLAANGMEVDVFERHSFVGGRTSTMERDGFRFDRGPTFFLYPRVLEEIFAAAGARLSDEVELVRLDPQYRLIFEDGPHLDATPDLDRMEAEVAKLSREDASHLREFMTANLAKLERISPIMQRPFESWFDLFDPELFRGGPPPVRPWQSIDSYLKRFFKDPRTRLAFSFQSKYLGMSPYRCPELFTILSGLEYEYGVFHPMGGCGAVTTAMARVAERIGVRIHLDEPVEELEFEGRRVSAVQTRTGRHAADAFLLNADFAHAMGDLVPDRLRRRWSDRKIETKRYSCSTFMMYLGVDGRYEEVAHHTIMMSRDYRDDLDAIESRHELTEHPSFYLHNPAATDSGLAPEGMSAIYALFPVTHRHENVDWSVERARYRELALDRLALAGLGDIRERIRSEKIVTPSDWENDLQVHRGAVFSLSHNMGQLLHMRPRNRFEELDGVYLAGGGTHPGSGLPVIFESSRIACRLLLEDLGVSGVRGCEPGEPETGVSSRATPQAPPVS